MIVARLSVWLPFVGWSGLPLRLELEVLAKP